MNDYQPSLSFCFQVRPDSLVFYPDSSGYRKSKSTSMVNDYCKAILGDSYKENFANTQYMGSFSKFARRNMCIALDCMSLIVKSRRILNPVINKWHNFKHSFITLTISSVKLVSYETSIEMLNAFIKYITRTENCTFYVWKLELQERGQIHFHILTDIFLHHAKLRLKWNRIQSAFGIILDGMNPNSTDIHSPYSSHDLNIYLRKYMTKIEEDKICPPNLKIKKHWGCCNLLQGVKRPVLSVELDDYDFKEKEAFLNKLCPNIFYPTDSCRFYHSRDLLFQGSISELFVNKFNYSNEIMDWKRSVAPNYFADSLF